MADEATLHDTLVSDEKTTVPTTEATPAITADAPKAPRISEAPDPEAAELGTILLQAGYNRTQINDLLQAPKALESLKYQIQNNPQEFLNMVERADPRLGEQFLEKMADTYVDRYGDRGKPAGKPNGEDQGLSREVEALRNKLNEVTTREERREQAINNAATRQRYDARVEDLFNLKEVKELGLTPSEQKAMKARLDVELSRDPSAVQRASSGNFVDVPRTFQTIIDEWAGDKKTAIDTAKAQRERTERGAFPEFQMGANPFFPPDELSKSAESWDATEAALAKVLERGAR